MARIDAAILGYRYWLDEPGNDVQWYFSENHALLFHTAAYLAGHLLPDARFARSGRTGAEQAAVGRDRVRGWLDHFERWEMAEFNSAPYFPIDLKGLTALFALAPDADIRDRAGRAIARLLEIVANAAHHGILTAAQGRSYEHSLCAGRSLELSSIARLLWGRGGFGGRFHALPHLALCLRDHGLAVPDALTARARWQGDGAQEWCFRQGEDGFAALYHCKTRAARWARPPATAGANGATRRPSSTPASAPSPQAQIWINHPGEAIQGGSGRPSYWGGSASIPRVQQYRGLALVAFDGAPPQPDFTHAWFPRRRLRRDRARRQRRLRPLRRRPRRRSSPTAPSRRSPPARAPAASSASPAAAAAGSSAVGATAKATSPPSARVSPASRPSSARTAPSSLTIPTTVWSSSTADGTVAAEGRSSIPRPGPARAHGRGSLRR